MWGFHEHSTIATEWIKLENTYLPSHPRKADKIPLVSMGGRAEGQACADPWVRTPIGASEIFSFFLFLPEGVIVGFQNVECVFKSQKKLIGVTFFWGDQPASGGQLDLFSEKQKVLRIAWNGEKVDRYKYAKSENK